MAKIDENEISGVTVLEKKEIDVKLNYMAYESEHFPDHQFRSISLDVPDFDMWKKILEILHYNMDIKFTELTDDGCTCYYLSEDKDSNNPDFIKMNMVGAWCKDKNGKISGYIMLR